jgi:hypothetical protein
MDRSIPEAGWNEYEIVLETRIVVHRRLSDNKATDNSESTSCSTSYEPERIPARIILDTNSPQLRKRKLLSKEVKDEGRTYVTTQDRTETSCEADYALSNAICKTHSIWWRHYDRVSECKLNKDDKALYCNSVEWRSRCSQK